MATKPQENELTAQDEISFESGFLESTYGALAVTFHPLYRFVFAGRGWTRGFEQQLRAANISTTPDLWLSGAFAIGAAFGGATAVIALFLSLIGIIPSIAPTVQLVAAGTVPIQVFLIINTFMAILGWLFTGLVAALSGIMLASGIAIAIPKIYSWRRRREIAIVQPDVVGFMHSLSASGMNEIEIFRAVARSEDVYGELAVEYQRIVHQADHLSTDFHTAVDDIATVTPNEDFSQFLRGCLSTIGSGGSLTDFLENAKESEQEARKRKLKQLSDVLLMVGQSYLTLMMLPMLLVIILVTMTIVSEPEITWLFAVVYLVTPVINLVFAFGIASIKPDRVGRGLIALDDGEMPGKDYASPFRFGPIEDFVDEEDHPVFKQIYRHEVNHTLVNYTLENPFKFFVDHPQWVLILTVPATLFGWAVFAVTGYLTPTWTAMTLQPLQQSLLWVGWPVLVLGLPYAAFYEYRQYTRSKILDTLAEDLRRVANINDTGQSFPEALKAVAEDSESKLSEEFGIMYKKLQMGVSLDRSLAETVNRYRIPRFARQMKIVEQAQEVSDNISDVLNTAADIAEYQQRIEKDRTSQMNVQLIVVMLSFYVFLLIMAGMDTVFIGLAEDILVGSSSEFGGLEDTSPTLLSMIFLHAALVQGISSGILSGYIKSADLSRGVKYAVLNTATVFVVFAGATLVDLSF